MELRAEVEGWEDLDIISSSSLNVALIGFDIAHNHLVRPPAATVPFVCDALM